MRRCAFPALLVLLCGAATAQEPDFNYLPLEVGNWWRYERMYSGPGEPNDVLFPVS